jgi:prefoldin alpha subunit
MMEQGSIPIQQLPMQQLQLIKQELEKELNMLTSSYGKLKSALVSFHNGQAALKSFNKENQDKSCLVPLTQSLYVKGVMSDVDNVMVDVGTGYYVDMVIFIL